MMWQSSRSVEMYATNLQLVDALRQQEEEEATTDQIIL